MPLLAHSARPKLGIPAQEYKCHVRAVEDAARTYSQDAARFWTGDRAEFEAAVAFAGRLHDLGKLDDKNQAVLNSSAREKLRVSHEDAGVKYLMAREHVEAAAMVYSHHAGLPGLVGELGGKGQYCLRRDPDGDKGDVTTRVDEQFENYAKLHHALFAPVPPKTANPAGRWAIPRRWSGLTWRLALSCLVDADHGNTATHYRNELPVDPPKVLWEARLAALHRHVGGLGGSDAERSERDGIRQQIYDELRWRSDLNKRLYACDSPVGTGKTTAVMAHLLRAAQEFGLRHILVVLPYVNIINQSVDTYRKALVLPGEDPLRIVAAHHHQADYQSIEARQLATLWDCPVTVTTAVQFFETLASNRPARLRKLHEIAGSAIFIDEAHAAIPSWLWPQTWQWIRELTDNWGCRIVLASGSLARFWNLEKIVNPSVELPQLVTGSVRSAAQEAERGRVGYIPESAPKNPAELMEFVFDVKEPGPRVVVLNTVQSAAVLAKVCRDAGRKVFHLSTALTPADRDRIVRQVEAELEGKFKDWALIGTSCIEAGLDFDFRFAVREIGPTASMIQLGGRLNRNGLQRDAVVAVVSLAPMDGFTEHRALRTQAEILRKCFEHGEVDKLTPADLCTLAMKKELDDTALRNEAELLVKAEDKREFREVAEMYRVIEEDTVTAVVDREVAEKLGHHERVDPLDIVKCSVRIRRKDVVRYGMKPIVEDEIYEWMLDYDPDLLGYMAGVLKLQDIGRAGFVIV